MLSLKANLLFTTTPIQLAS